MAKRRQRSSASPKAEQADPKFAARLEQAKAESIAQLLFKCARLLNEQALARVELPEGAPRIRPAHTSLFPHIDLAGTRLTDLAKRVGVSKQAVGQLVDELEQLGVIERVADPQDGRAKLIRFRQKRGKSLHDGLAHLKKFEDELATVR